MTAAKHTPGPWRLELWKYDQGKRIVHTIQNDSDAVAQIPDLWCMDDRADEKEANARLIAAAPDGLAFAEAAAGVIAWAMDNGADCEAMEGLEAMRRAFIAKATGAA